MLCDYFHPTLTAEKSVAFVRRPLAQRIGVDLEISAKKSTSQIEVTEKPLECQALMHKQRDGGEKEVKM